MFDCVLECVRASVCAPKWDREQEQEQESLFVFRPLASFTKNMNASHIYAAQ